MQKYDAVIFDLFGTLVDSSPYEAVRGVITAMARTLGAPPETFFRHWMGATRHARARGALGSIEANLEHLCEKLEIGVREDQVREATALRYAFTREALTPRPDVIPTLLHLEETGHRRGLISDCSPDVPHLWGDTLMAPHIDVPIFSCAVGLAKPDPRIYETACTRLGVAPKRCLFVGDGDSEELTGASRVGMDALLIRVPYDQGFRQKEDSWDGPRIEAIGELLSYLD